MQRFSYLALGSSVTIILVLAIVRLRVHKDGGWILCSTADAFGLVRQSRGSLAKGLVQRASLVWRRVRRLTVQSQPSSARVTSWAHSLDAQKHMQVKSFTAPGPPEPDLEKPEPSQITSLTKGRKGTAAPAQRKEDELCKAPMIDYEQLKNHGCLARHDVCMDQNRFITFDERMMPGPGFQNQGLFFDQHAHHNIPGYLDNIMGAKSKFYEVMARANSSADPEDIQDPAFQRCEVPLVWWPWWPFNAADVYMGSLMPLERMLREGAVDDQVTLVPVLDGFRLPTFYHWWFAPFFRRKVTPLADLSDRSRAGQRCFELVLMCSPQGIFSQPSSGDWLNGTLPFSVGQKMALIERSKTRHIVNLPDLVAACNSELTAAGRTPACSALSFDGAQDFPGLLQELQTTDVLVGVHGAGLINAFFMRPGSAMVEIFPCRFPVDWASHYFWRPALVEKRIMPFQIRMQDEARCQPSELERNPGGVNYLEGAEFVRASLARDQDIVVDFKALQQVIGRIKRLEGNLDSLPLRLANLSPSYFVVTS